MNLHPFALFNAYTTLHSNSPSIIHKVRWTPQEDHRLIQAVQNVGRSNWRIVADALSGRTGKQCRERWLNHLAPSVIRETWTPREDAILLESQKVKGNSWASIAQFLPGRSPSHVKNRWAYLCRREGPQYEGPVMSRIAESVTREIRFPVLESLQTIETEWNGEQNEWGSK
jgi:hypothetical protein